jgi:hypothetical protein
MQSISSFIHSQNIDEEQQQGIEKNKKSTLFSNIMAIFTPTQD